MASDNWRNWVELFVPYPYYVVSITGLGDIYVQRAWLDCTTNTAELVGSLDDFDDPNIVVWLSTELGYGDLGHTPYTE